MGGSKQALEIDKVRRALAMAERLSFGQIAVLLSAAEKPGMSINELAEFNGLSQQTTSRYVSMLSGRYSESEDQVEYLSQSLGLDDPRKRFVALNENGETFVKKFLDTLYR